MPSHRGRLTTARKRIKKLCFLQKNTLRRGSRSVEAVNEPQRQRRIAARGIGKPCIEIGTQRQIAVDVMRQAHARFRPVIFRAAGPDRLADAERRHLNRTIATRQAMPPCAAQTRHRVVPKLGACFRTDTRH